MTFQVRRDDSLRVAFCHQPVDDDGSPIPLGQTRFYVINAATGAVVQDLGVLAPVSGVQANGSYLYEGPPRTYLVDITLAVVAEYLTLRSLPSTPITVDVRGERGCRRCRGCCRSSRGSAG